MTCVCVCLAGGGCSGTGVGVIPSGGEGLLLQNSPSRIAAKEEPYDKASIRGWDDSNNP